MLSLAEIVSKLGGELASADCGNINIAKIGSLLNAKEDAIAFYLDSKYKNQLTNTNAAAIVLKPEDAALTNKPAILSDNPRSYFAKLAALLNGFEMPKSGIHPSAVVAATAKIATTASIGAQVVIEDGVIIGENVIIGAGCVLEQGVQIAASTKLESRVTVKSRVRIGARCHLFSGCVIGSDGFGYAPENGSWVKVPHVGSVEIADDVDIGANTTIDRGALDDTCIENSVKIDNLVHIAHNCRIGANTVIAGCVGIAGSAIIGARCQIGGAGMILGHLTIADDVIISPGTMVMSSIESAGKYTAIMPALAHKDWLKMAAQLRHIDELAQKIKQLEAHLKC